MKTEIREEEIQAVLAEKIRPVLAAHQGGIELSEIAAGGVVHLRILGACASCMGAEQTIKDVIVAGIRESCAWVTDVRVESGVSEDLVREALGFLRKRRESQ